MSNNEQNLNREINVFGGVSILTGIMVASGIFFIGAQVLERTGFSMGLALLAWVIGGLITLMYGLIYAELGASMPVAGGYYIYLKEAYGKPVAFMSGFTNFALLSSGSIAALAIAFSQILDNIFLNLFKVSIAFNLQILISAMMILGLTVVNYYGVKLGALIQKVFFVVKAIPILLLLILGLALGEQSVDFSISLNGESIFSLLAMLGFTVIATFWAYEGWTNLNTVAGEVKNPGRTIPLSLIITVASVTALYTLFNISLFNVLSLAEMREMIDGGMYFIGIPAAMVLMGTAGMYLVMFTMLIAVFGALHGTILAFPRVYYAMAKDDLLFNSFKRLDKKYKTPVYAIFGSGMMAIVLLIFSLQELITMVAFGALFFNAMIFVSVFIFRKQKPDLKRPYKVWGYPVLPIITILITVLLLVATFIESPVQSLIGTAVIIAGLPVYYLVRYLKNRQEG